MSYSVLIEKPFQCYHCPLDLHSGTLESEATKYLNLDIRLSSISMAIHNGQPFGNFQVELVHDLDLDLSWEDLAVKKSQ